MPAAKYTRPTVWVPPAVPLVLQPQPPLAPSLPPAHVVDLMTDAGSAAFGAVWRAKEAKLVECRPRRFLTNSGSRDDISRIVRCQSGTGEREYGQIMRRTAAWGG